MPGFRAERIAGMIHRELAERLRGLKDPRLLEISITRVEVTRDLRIAKISYLRFGGGEISDELHAAVLRAASRLRGPVGRVLRLRHSPELRFEIDTHTEAAFRVNDLLRQIDKQNKDCQVDDADEEVS
ncbi:MAG: 30S ribosome-binding factor RbfA [Proteobacteria bacterium]|nr:30S ribosome-binding factor RbfA [Pseudomonadota bacterium]